MKTKEELFDALKEIAKHEVFRQNVITTTEKLNHCRNIAREAIKKGK